jgi:hypothetical protein
MSRAKGLASHVCLKGEYMEDFEKLGAFYLGREYDFENKKSKENLLLYDSRDLLTHAVAVGMTGSGKTGLCIGLLEEAAIDGIPSVIIDPKGDLSNLFLTFPDLKPDDFMPWINAEDARKKGLSTREYADKQAQLWKKGLAGWGQDGARIQRLRDAADFIIYTPGSSAGIPVSILKSFEAPPQALVADTDLLRERINTTVTSLLNLLGIEADPLQSREHILLSTILDSAWKNGQNLDLTNFIQGIQSPPFSRIGVFDIESFFPSKDRFSLAMKLNNLLAAPGFQTWLEGEPLEMDRIMYTSEGKPRVSIFSIAHLSDAERMFFVSLLLTQLMGWMRTQSGTTSLRALFYMDEIYGYFPPVANPPSKSPLMTLLKQARAFGLGLVLATQNPVDLDYKGLSNIGTWFIGRLQTEKDKERMMEGLEGAGAGTAGGLDRKKMDRLLSGLGKRIFLMNNVHEDAPVIFETRWVMSYLRGPMTRNQIKRLMGEKKAASPSPAAPSEKTERPAPPKKTVMPSHSSRPVLPPGIPEYFIPVLPDHEGENDIFYEPMLLGSGNIYYSNAKAGVATEDHIVLITNLDDDSSGLNWDEATPVSFSDEALDKFPESQDASYNTFPKSASIKKNYIKWGKSLREWLYRNKKLELLKSQSLKVVSQPGEDERDFRIRLQLTGHEKRDALIEKIRKKYTSKITTLEDRIRRAEHTVEREKEQAKQQKLQAALSFGATLFGALLGRKKLSSSTLGRATTTAGRAGRVLKESKDIELAQENVDELKERLAQLQEQLAAETEEAKLSISPLTEKLDSIEIKPKKKDIAISLVALVWGPYGQTEKGGITPLW